MIKTIDSNSSSPPFYQAFNSIKLHSFLALSQRPTHLNAFISASQCASLPSYVSHSILLEKDFVQSTRLVGRMHSHLSFFFIFLQHTQALFDYYNDTKSPEKNDIDRGYQYGSVILKNWCNYGIYIQSVGAWEHPGNFSEDKDRSMIQVTIPAGGSYHEAYRQSCPKPSSHASMIPPPTCQSLRKMEGQAPCIKISNTTEGPENIIQLEYALIKNPERHDNFIRLDYDVSLLNCAQISGLSEKQVEANPELTRKKFAECPGIRAGLALWFDNTDLCRPIYCDGQTYCDGIYNYSPTEPGEDSFACHQEYMGNMYFEMCVGNGDGYVCYHSMPLYHLGNWLTFLRIALQKYLEWAGSHTTASQLPTSTPTKFKGPWTTDIGFHTSMGSSPNTKAPDITQEPTLTAIDRSEETPSLDGEEYVSRPAGPGCPEFEKTVSTVIQQTITISRPKPTSSSDLSILPTAPPTPTDRLHSNSRTKSYAISCDYDESLGSEVCWSQMPLKTPNNVTVTTTVVFTETPNPVIVTSTAFITKFVTSFPYVTKIRSSENLTNFQWPQSLATSILLTHTSTTNPPSLFTTIYTLSSSNNTAIPPIVPGSSTSRYIIPSSSLNSLSAKPSSSTILVSSSGDSPSTTILPTASPSSTCTVVSPLCEHQKQSYGKSPEGEQDCKDSPCIKKWCGNCMTMENEEWGCQCFGVVSIPINSGRRWVTMH